MKNTNAVAFISVASLFIILLSPKGLLAEFYKYITEDGAVHYADDLTKVPEKYRDQITTYKEKYDYYSDEERVLMIQKEKEAAEKAASEKNRREAELRKRSSEQSSETKVIIRDNQILVPVTIGNGIFDYQTLLLLDTGASHTVLHRQYANRINVLALDQNMAQLAGGKTVVISNATLDYIKVGPYRMNNAGVILMDYTGPPVNYSGLLGMNFLRNLQYSIDYENKKIVWKRR